ncbi:MAG: hypothetical protein HYV77_04005 [Candidatus Wildermuthbacteria bacterium]|nr:hypothetical protein [Candidatus Wildermuthbacteria bacterium]
MQWRWPGWLLALAAVCLAGVSEFMVPRVFPASNEEFVHENLPKLLEGRFVVKELPSRSIMKPFPELGEAQRVATGILLEPDLPLWTSRGSYEEHANALQNETAWVLELVRVRETGELFIVGRLNGAVDFWMFIDKDIHPDVLGVLLPVIVGETGPSGYLFAWRAEKQKDAKETLRLATYAAVVLAALFWGAQEIVEAKRRRAAQTSVQEEFVAGKARRKRQAARAGVEEIEGERTPSIVPTVPQPPVQKIRPLPLTQPLPKQRQAPVKQPLAEPNMPKKWMRGAQKRQGDTSAEKKGAAVSPLEQAQAEFMKLLRGLQENKAAEMPGDAELVSSLLVRWFVRPTQTRSFIGGHSVSAGFLRKSFGARVSSSQVDELLKWLVKIGVVNEIAGRSYAFNPHPQNLGWPGREIGEAVLKIASAKLR